DGRAVGQVHAGAGGADVVAGAAVEANLGAAAALAGVDVELHADRVDDFRPAAVGQRPAAVAESVDAARIVLEDEDDAVGVVAAVRVVGIGKVGGEGADRLLRAEEGRGGLAVGGAGDVENAGQTGAAAGVDVGH